MITENQLRALDFEYNDLTCLWEFKDITVWIAEDDQEVYLGNFELFGINDHRDLSKFIKLVYGE